MQYLDYNGLSTFKSLLDKIYPKLDDNNKIPSSYLPSYVDDVLEFDTQSSFPATGESGKIYLTADTNKSYRWTGSGYAEISSSLALGETSATAYRGDRGKIAYDHSQKSHSLTIAENSVSALGGTLTKDTLLTSLGLSSAASDITSLKAHVANGDIHVTADDKTTWNSAVETLDTHTKDTTIHITSDERTKWNNNISSLSTHIADSTKHITASERTAWNAKWDYNEATIKAVKVNNATTADKVGHTLTFADGTTFNGSADKSIGKAQVGLDKVENKTITVTSSSVSDGTNTFNKYTHPAHSAVTIASADGRVLGNISVDSLGHVTSVGYKALGFGDLPSLYIGKTKVQSSAKAQALTGISSITLEGSTAELKWDDDKSTWRLSGNLLVDGFVASGGTGSSGGSSGGAVDVSYVANLTAGTLLGTLTINGTDYQILAPSLTASSINAALGNIPVARATADAEGNSISGTYAKTSALPTKVSQLTNDSGYLTAITKAMVEGVLTGNITSHTHSQYLTAHQSVTLASGTNNGTLKLTVGSTTTDNIAVKGLGSAAYTDSSAYAPASHTHTFASLTSKPTTISGYGITDGLRLVRLANNVENDFNTFENLTLTGRGDPTIGSSLLNSPWTTQPAGGFGVLTYLWSGYGFQLAVGYGHNDLYIRKRYYISSGAAWDTRWDKILNSSNYNSYAPTLTGVGASGTWGINISGNAATATKLATARTIWGQSFDGTDNVDGYMFMNGLDVLHLDESSLWLNYGAADEGKSLRLCGNDVAIYYGKSTNFARAMTINSSGNITIGASDLAGTANKLYVDGHIRMAASGQFKVSDASSEYGVMYLSSTYGLYLGSGASDKYDTLLWGKNINLVTGINGQTRVYVKNDGNVGIGTTSPSYKLHVNGNLGVAGAATLASLTLNGTNLLEWDESNSAWKFNGNLIATGFIASGDISAQAAALAEEEDRIAALEAQVAELQAEIATLKAQ